MRDDNAPDEILDDVFVLCRAFEVTWSDQGTETKQAEEAVAETIAQHGITELRDVQALVRQLRSFRHVSALTCDEWFGRPNQDDPTDSKTWIVSTQRALNEALAVPSRWTSNDSRRLGRALYRMRSAVIHASLETDNDLAPTVLPALRRALVELTIARTATRYGITLEDARGQFEQSNE